MKVVSTLVLEGSQDTYLIKRFSNLEGWLGIDGRAEDDPIRKAFRRIRGNNATLADVNFALTQSLVEATRLGDDAETGPCPFPEIPGQGSVEQTWRDGLRLVPVWVRREVAAIADIIRDETGIDILTESSSERPPASARP